MQRPGVITSAASGTGTYCTVLATAITPIAQNKTFTLGGVLVSTSVIITFLSGASGSVQPQLVDPQGTTVSYGSAITASTFLSVNSPIFGIQLSVTSLTGGNLYLAIFSTLL